MADNTEFAPAGQIHELAVHGGVGVGHGAEAYHGAQALHNAVVVHADRVAVRAQLRRGAEFKRAQGHYPAPRGQGRARRAEGEFCELLHHTSPFL